MIPLALGLGIVAGVREGSIIDRTISIGSILTTSVPEFASAVFLTALFVFTWHVLPGVSTMARGFDLRELIMPVSVLALSSTGYLARDDPRLHGRGDGGALYKDRPAQGVPRSPASCSVTRCAMP